MERLTEKRDGQNVIPLRQNGEVKWALSSAGMGDAPTQFLYGVHADKLAEYEDLEEQNKLLKLPCAVGDTVYYADNEYYFTVLPVKVDEISIMESNAILYKCLLFDGNGDVETQFDFDKDDFGKTVFLTRQEAEDKPEEMEGKK